MSDTQFFSKASEQHIHKTFRRKYTYSVTEVICATNTNGDNSAFFSFDHNLVKAHELSFEIFVSYVKSTIEQFRQAGLCS